MEYNFTHLREKHPNVSHIVSPDLVFLASDSIFSRGRRKVKLLIHRKLVSQIKNWWWSVFALFLTMFFGISFIGWIIQNTDLTILQRLQASVDIIGLLALWGLGLQRPIFQNIFWCLFFFVNLIIDVSCVIFGQRYELSLLWCLILYLVFLTVAVPYYIGIFIYAFRSKQIWKKEQDEPAAIYTEYPYHKWLRRKRWLGFLKSSATVALIILCLTFIPEVIRNNRVVYPWGNPPRSYERMLKHRRTTIPELQEFERLFPNYLCEFDCSESNLIIDPHGIGKNIAYIDPNLSVKWRLSAGLHKRYLFVMETDIVFAKIDPETGKLLSPGSHEEPAFTLWEVDSVSAPLVLFEKRYALPSSLSQVKTLNIDEWTRLVAAQGNFAVLGIQLKKNTFVPNFGLAFRNNE
jgi:hypothetical protein